MSERGGAVLLTVQRAIRCLDLVAAAGRPLTVRELAAALEHNVSSTYHLINTLVVEECLSRLPDGGLVIGSRIDALARRVDSGAVLVEAAAGVVDRLAADTGETVYLTEVVGDRAVVRYCAESAHSLRVSGLTIGYGELSDVRAAGRAVLAALPDERRVEALNRLLRNVPDPLRRGRAEAAVARAVTAGYAVEREEFEPGVSCVAAAFRDARGLVAGSVSLSVPTVRAAQLDTVLRDHVLAAAAAITIVLRNRAVHGRP